MTTQIKLIGTARIIDCQGDVCRARLLDESGRPTGAVWEAIIVTDNIQWNALARQYTEAFAPLSDHELDTAARQNLYYNSHLPVTIE